MGAGMLLVFLSISCKVFSHIYTLIRVNNNGTISKKLQFDSSGCRAYQEHQTKVHTDINVVIFINNVPMK